MSTTKMFGKSSGTDDRDAAAGSPTSLTSAKTRPFSNSRAATALFDRSRMISSFRRRSVRRPRPTRAAAASSRFLNSAGNPYFFSTTNVGNEDAQQHRDSAAKLQNRLEEILIFELRRDGSREYLHLSVRGLYRHVIRAITTTAVPPPPPPAPVVGDEDDEDVDGDDEEEQCEQHQRSFQDGIPEEEEEEEDIGGSSHNDDDEDGGGSKEEKQVSFSKLVTVQEPDETTEKQEILQAPSSFFAEGTTVAANNVVAPPVSAGDEADGSSHREASAASDGTALDESDLRTIKKRIGRHGRTNSFWTRPTGGGGGGGTGGGGGGGGGNGGNTPSDAVTYRERLGGYLHPRDMRRLVTPFSASNEPELIVRRHVMLFNFDTLRAVILRDRLLVIVPEGADSLLITLEKLVRGGTIDMEYSFATSNTAASTTAGSNDGSHHYNNLPSSAPPSESDYYAGTDGDGDNVDDYDSNGDAYSSDVSLKIDDEQQQDEEDSLGGDSSAADSGVHSGGGSRHGGTIIGRVLGTHRRGGGGGDSHNQDGPPDHDLVDVDDDKPLRDSSAHSTTFSRGKAAASHVVSKIKRGVKKMEHRHHHRDSATTSTQQESVEAFYPEWEEMKTKDWIDLPFELQCTDAVLHVVCSILSDDTSTLQERTFKYLNNVLSGQYGLSDDPLSGLRHMKDAIHEMGSRVKGFVQSMNRILDEDEDMALMNLTRLITHPNRFIKPVSQELLEEEADEPELILEAHLQIGLTLSNSLDLIQGQIDTASELVDQKLDSVRNRILFANMIISVLSLCVATASLVGSLFGMNVLNYVEEDPDAFKIITTSTVVGCVTLMVVIMTALFFSGAIPSPGLSDKA